MFELHILGSKTPINFIKTFWSVKESKLVSIVGNRLELAESVTKVSLLLFCS